MGEKLEDYKCDNRGSTEVENKVSKPTNHILHLLLTWFTGGIWLIPWILIGTANDYIYTCKCGNTTTTEIGSERAWAFVGIIVVLIIIGFAFLFSMSMF